MITIEHKPTEPDVNRLEKPETPQKGRKKDGLGGFGRILAGLLSKKTQPEAGTFRGTDALDALNKGKGNALDKSKLLLKKTGDDVSAALQKGKKQKETAHQSELEAAMALLQLNQAKAEIPNAADQEPAITARQVSFNDLPPERQSNTLEQRFPFRNRAEPSVEGEAKNASLQSLTNQDLRSKKEAAQGLENKAESKKTDRRRDRVSVEVYDLRTQTGSESGVIAEQGLKGAEELRNQPDAEIVLDLRPAGERQNGAAGAENKAAGGENFAQILARELNGDLSTDIVKQAAVILRDGGEGTIKLSLKPETLGKVKIHMEMAENKIVGHIIVETEEALRAFEQEIHTLEQAFEDSGFEASLSTALDYRNDQQQWKEEAPQPFFSERLAVSYEEQAEFSGEFNYWFSAVNVLV